MFEGLDSHEGLFMLADENYRVLNSAPLIHICGDVNVPCSKISEASERLCGEKGDRLALSALELESKILGMFANDQDKSEVRAGPGLTIQLLNQDGTLVITTPGADHVTPNLPMPERRGKSVAD